MSAPLVLRTLVIFFGIVGYCSIDQEKSLGKGAFDLQRLFPKVSKAPVTLPVILNDSILRLPGPVNRVVRSGVLCPQFYNENLTNTSVWCEPFWHLNLYVTGIFDTISISFSVLCIVLSLFGCFRGKRTDDSNNNFPDAAETRQELRQSYFRVRSILRWTPVQYPEVSSVPVSILYYLYVIFLSANQMVKYVFSKCSSETLINLHELSTSQSDNRYCLALFCLSYFFVNFAAICWLMLGVIFFLSVVKDYAPEALAKRQRTFCFVSVVCPTLALAIATAVFVDRNCYTELSALCVSLLGDSSQMKEPYIVMGSIHIFPVLLIITGDVLVFIAGCKIPGKYKIAGFKSLSLLPYQLIIIAIIFNVPLGLAVYCVFEDYRTIEMWLNPCLSMKYVLHPERLPFGLITSSRATSIYCSKALVHIIFCPFLGPWMLTNWLKMIDKLIKVIKNVNTQRLVISESTNNTESTLL